MLRNMLLLGHDISLLTLVLAFCGSRSPAVLAAGGACYLIARAFSHRVRASAAAAAGYGVGLVIAYVLTGKFSLVTPLITAVAVVLGVRAAQIAQGQTAFTRQLAARMVLVGVLVVVPSLVGYGSDFAVPAALCIYMALLTAVVENKGRWLEIAVVTLLFMLAAAAVGGIEYLNRALALVWYIFTRFILLFVWVFLLLFGWIIDWAVENSPKAPAEIWQELAANLQQAQQPVDELQAAQPPPGWVQIVVIAVVVLALLAVVILVVRQLRRGAAEEVSVVGLVREGITAAEQDRPTDSSAAGQDVVYCDNLPPNNRKVCKMFTGYLRRLGYNPAQLTSLTKLADTRLVHLFNRARYSYREIQESAVKQCEQLIGGRK